MTAVKIKEVAINSTPETLQIVMPKVWVLDNGIKKGTRLQIMRATDKDLGDIIIIAKMQGGKK